MDGIAWTLELRHSSLIRPFWQVEYQKIKLTTIPMFDYGKINT